MGVMKAMKVTPDVLDLAALGLSIDDVKPLAVVKSFHPPAERPPVKMMEGEPAGAADELARLLSEEAGVI